MIKERTQKPLQQTSSVLQTCLNVLPCHCGHCATCPFIVIITKTGLQHYIAYDLLKSHVCLYMLYLYVYIYIRLYVRSHKSLYVCLFMFARSLFRARCNQFAYLLAVAIFEMRPLNLIFTLAHTKHSAAAPLIRSLAAYICMYVCVYVSVPRASSAVALLASKPYHFGAAAGGWLTAWLLSAVFIFLKAISYVSSTTFFFYFVCEFCICCCVFCVHLCVCWHCSWRWGVAAAVLWRFNCCLPAYPYHVAASAHCAAHSRLYGHSANYAFLFLFLFFCTQVLFVLFV